MSLFDRRKKREIEVDKKEADVFIETLIPSGNISVDEALNIPAFNGCISLIANTVASLPIYLYEENDGKTMLKEDERVQLLNDDTGDILDGVQFKKAIVMDYLLNGNGYAYINRNGNKVRSLHYVPSTSVSSQKGTDPIFKDVVIRVNGKTYEEYDFILLLRNSKDGVTGTGIVEELVQPLTSYFNIIRYEKILTAMGGNKKGFLQSEKRLAIPAIEALKSAWRRLYSNPEPSCIVLNDGIKFTEASQTSVEMQLNELRRTADDEICKALGVPSSIFSGGASDEAWQMFFRLAVNPVIKAFEAALNKNLLLISERKNKYFAFDTKELLKGDMLKRYQAYAIALSNGFLQIDDVRYMEDLEPLDLEFIKLGLQDVLYNPKTKQIYTPNTDKTSVMGAESTEKISENELQDEQNRGIINNRYNENHDPDNGKFTSGNGGGASSSDVENENIIVSEHSKGIETQYKVYSEGRRNEKHLTEEQVSKAIEAARKQGYKGQVEYSPYLNTSILPGDPNNKYNNDGNGSLLIIGTDAYPSKRNGTANEMISLNGAMAHEVVGHYSAWLKGTTQSNIAMEEAQASIRASKFGVGLTEAERKVLLQDGLARLTRAGLDYEEVKNKLDIWET